MEEPTNIQSHLNPVDTCGTQHSAAEYLLFSSAYSIFPKIDHILNYKTCFSRFQKTESLRNMFSDCSGVILKINNNKNLRKPQKFGN